MLQQISLSRARALSLSLSLSLSRRHPLTHSSLSSSRHAVSPRPHLVMTREAAGWPGSHLQESNTSDKRAHNPSSQRQKIHAASSAPGTAGCRPYALQHMYSRAVLKCRVMYKVMYKAHVQPRRCDDIQTLNGDVPLMRIIHAQNSEHGSAAGRYSLLRSPAAHSSAHPETRRGKKVQNSTKRHHVCTLRHTRPPVTLPTVSPRRRRPCGGRRWTRARAVAALP